MTGQPHILSARLCVAAVLSQSSTNTRDKGIGTAVLRNLVLIARESGASAFGCGGIAASERAATTQPYPKPPEHIAAE
jgi:hypothetical protein